MKKNNRKKLKLPFGLERSLLLLILLFCLSLAIHPVFAQINSPDKIQLIQQGKQYYNSGQFLKAIPLWQQAIEIFPNNSLNQSMALSNLSLTYQQLGDWEKADAAIIKSLKIVQSLKTTTEQQRILAQALDIQGQLQQKTGQSQTALNTWQKAAQLYPNSVDKKINQINQAQVMQDLGLYPRACQTLLQTLDINNQKCQISAQEITTIKQEILANSPNNYKIRALRSLGNVLRVIGDFQKSETILRVSLALAQQSNSSTDESKVLLNLGNTERALANRAKEIGDEQTVENYRTKALANYQKAATLASSILQIQSQLNQLELLIENKKWQESEILISKIKVLLINLPLSRETIHAQINYTKNLLCLRQKNLNCLNPKEINLSSVDKLSFSEAIQNLKNVVQDAAKLQDKRTQSYAVGLLGRLYESRQEWNTANYYTQQALDNSLQAQALELTYQWQWQQGRLLKAQGKTQTALAVYAKAVETLKSLRNDLVSINPENQFTFRESTEPVYREYVSLLLQPQDNAVIPPKNLETARETIDSLQLAELENFFRVVCIDTNPVVIDKITDQKDPTAAVIYPILLEDRFEIIFKLPQEKSLRHYTTPIENKKVVERILNRLAYTLTQSNSPDTLDLAQKVYDWLLRPAQKDLAQSQVKTLVFVLDSALRNIPMSVLHNGQQYLVQQYSIASSPSLQLLDPQPFREKKSNALIAGLSEAQDNFSALTHVPEELEKIRLQVPSSIKLLNATFTKNGLRNTLNSAPFSVVHLATHGQFSSQAEGTFILTWQDRLNIDELNNLLRSKDSQPIELLVLSACETLKGDNRAALGLAGVAVRAGTRSTLATLWQVNDEATARLMDKFYQALQDQTMTKANALRQAQLALLNDPDSVNRNPHFWAAYVLLGNWL